VADKIKEYHKLPGFKKGFFIGRYSLWQATDHLLLIFSRFGIEDYKRFYFSDIQAIITRKTVVGKAQNIILGGLILLCGLPAIFFDDGWSIFFSAGASFVLILLLINLLRGPTCETRLMTAVQNEKLPSLRRLKKTFKIMDRLRLPIRQAQGTLTTEDLNQIPPQPGTRRASQGTRQAVASPAAAHDNGRVHLMVFALLSFDGVLVTFEFFISHVVLTILSSVASLGLGILVIIALVRQHNSDLPGSLRTLTWTALGYAGVTFVMGYIVGMMFAYKNPSMAYNQWEIVKAVAGLSPWDSPLKLGCNILVLGGAVFLGIPGLIIQQRCEHRAKEPAASAPNLSRPTAGYRAPEPG